MSTIILYIYLAICVIVYIFIQLNYMFTWFKSPMFDDAFTCIFLGLFVSFFWPLFAIVCLVMNLAAWMDDVHDKHK